MNNMLLCTKKIFTRMAVSTQKLAGVGHVALVHLDFRARICPLTIMTAVQTHLVTKSRDLHPTTISFSCCCYRRYFRYRSISFNLPKSASSTLNLNRNNISS